MEDFVLPLLLRDAQVLTVWEETANILGLEVIRLMKEYQAHTIFLDEMKSELHLFPNHLFYLTKSVWKGLQKLEKLMDYVATSTEEKTFKRFIQRKLLN